MTKKLFARTTPYFPFFSSSTFIYLVIMWLGLWEITLESKFEADGIKDVFLGSCELDGWIIDGWRIWPFIGTYFFWQNQERENSLLASWRNISLIERFGYKDIQLIESRFRTSILSTFKIIIKYYMEMFLNQPVIFNHMFCSWKFVKKYKRFWKWNELNSKLLIYSSTFLKEMWWTKN